MATSERFQPGGCLEQKLYKAAQAGNAQTLCYVLEHGADVSYQNNEGVSPLMVAAENGHADIVRILLEAGSPWNAQDKDGYCAGDYATASKRQEIVELLMHWGVQAELLLAAVERLVSCCFAVTCVPFGPHHSPMPYRLCKLGKVS